MSDTLVVVDGDTTELPTAIKAKREGHEMDVVSFAIPRAAKVFGGVECE
ncbi:MULTISPECIES: hypothetical protein [unclassified Haloarcula]|nr:MULTISPECIES: hypothetical protein [unclassified Haloarcula]